MVVSEILKSVQQHQPHAMADVGEREICGAEVDLSLTRLVIAPFLIFYLKTFALTIISHLPS